LFNLASFHKKNPSQNKIKTRHIKEDWRGKTTQKPVCNYTARRA